MEYIWGADLLIIKFFKEFRFLLSVTDIYSKYAWVIPLKDKKAIIIITDFLNISNESKRKSNKKCINKGN